MIANICDLGLTSLWLYLTSSVKNIGNLTSLLRWPTAPTGYIATPCAANFTSILYIFDNGNLIKCVCIHLPFRMEMPVVEVRKHGLWLLAKNVSLYCFLLLVSCLIVNERYVINFCSHFCSYLSGETIYSQNTC